MSECWQAVEKALEEKKYVSKDKYGDYETKKGLNRIPGAVKLVKELVASEVDNVLEQKGSLVLKNLDKHVLGKNNAITLFGVSLKRMMTLAVMELYAKPSIFEWCPCISNAKRMVLALNVVNDICRQYAPQERLRYTSIATGSLLQDYIILQELKYRGFKIMTINLIDPGYFSPAELANLKKLMPLPKDKKHADYLLTMAHHVDKLEQEVDDATDSTVGADSDNDTASVYSDDQSDDGSSVSLDDDQEELFNDLERFIDTVALSEFKKRLKGDASKIEIIAWENAHDYFERAKKYPKERSDVFLLIDPEMGYFVQPPYPSLANIIRLIPDGNKNESVYVTIPAHAAAQVWTCSDEVKKSALYKKVAELHKTKKGNLLKTALIELYTPTMDDKGNKTLVVRDGKKITMEYIVDLYVLAQDMMFEGIADPAKTVVYMGKKEISKIDPLVYRKEDVVGERAREICTDSSEVSSAYSAEIDPLFAESLAVNTKWNDYINSSDRKDEVKMYNDYLTKMNELNAKIDEINARYGFAKKE